MSKYAPLSHKLDHYGNIMPPFLRFLIYRLLSVPLTLLIITVAIYGFAMLTPPSVRATLYLSEGANLDHLTEEQLDHLIQMLVVRNHLDDPFPVQYAYWAANLVRGKWGWSPALRDDVLRALVRRTPVTAELTLYSLILFMPLGLVFGMIAGWNKGRKSDNWFRLSAFVATSLPPFILALILLAIFYAGLGWFPPERLSITNNLLVKSDQFQTFTGLMTVDGFLNGRPDISLDAFRHLVMPVIVLCLFHWATLGRVTRAALIEETQKEYLTAAKAHGIPDNRMLWRHAFRNVLSPALTSSALSAAALFTGVFIVEVIFNFRGVSDIVTNTSRELPDAPAILGFAVYSVLIVLILMLVLDIVQASSDPRLRQGIMGS